MIHLYKSDTGQFVLVHAPSQTTIIDDDLPSGFSKMESYIEENHPDLTGEITPNFEPHRVTERGSRVFSGATFLLILLPFLWLGILHQSMGSLVEKYLEKSGAETESNLTLDSLQGQVQDLRGELNTLGQRIERMSDQKASE